MKERIQKVLGNAGVASRRAVEEMVLQGRIAVNGKVVWTLPVLVDPTSDRITVDDETIKLVERSESKRVYVLLNKPKGVYCTNVAQGAQVRAIDLLPPQIRERLYPVGRLDAESHGLLLLTNDGELTHRLTHPRFGVPKTYRAIVDGQVGTQVVKDLQEGVWLADVRTGKGVKTAPSHVRVTRRLRDKSVLEITIREGVNREVRRMLAKLGHKVRDLIRLRMGPLNIDGLTVGKCRPLTPKELRDLKRLAQSDPKPHSGSVDAAPEAPLPGKAPSDAEVDAALREAPSHFVRRGPKRPAGRASAAGHSRRSASRPAGREPGASAGQQHAPRSGAGQKGRRFTGGAGSAGGGGGGFSVGPRRQSGFQSSGPKRGGFKSKGKAR